VVNKISVLIPIIAAAIVVGVVGLIFVPPEIKNRPTHLPEGKVRIDNNVIKVEIAKSDAEKQRWLMFRHQKLPLDSAMILIYKKPDLYSMWLLNIEFNLDLMWFSENGNIVYIVKDAPPCKSTFDIANCTYKNTKPAKYIIAATSGFINKYKITSESKISII
jgi:uncharacterized membrane protein (UPF0127 family)